MKRLRKLKQKLLRWYISYTYMGDSVKNDIRNYFRGVRRAQRLKQIRLKKAPFDISDMD
jgi:hypothetical protein